GPARMQCPSTSWFVQPAFWRAELTSMVRLDKWLRRQSPCTIPEHRSAVLASERIISPDNGPTRKGGFSLTPRAAVAEPSSQPPVVHRNGVEHEDQAGCHPR